MKRLKTFVFQGFGFDILLKDVLVKSIDGEDYPSLNIKELKINTAKALLNSKQSLTGYQLKFLRTYLRLSFDELSEKIRVPASTLRSWESRGSKFTGFEVAQEKAFRILAINQMLEDEKCRFNIEVTLIKEFQTPSELEALDIASSSESMLEGNEPPSAI